MKNKNLRELLEGGWGGPLPGGWGGPLPGGWGGPLPGGPDGGRGGADTLFPGGPLPGGLGGAANKYKCKKNKLLKNISTFFSSSLD